MMTVIIQIGGTHPCYTAKIQGGPDILKGKRFSHPDDAKFAAKQIVDRDYKGLVAVAFEVDR